MKSHLIMILFTLLISSCKKGNIRIKPLHPFVTVGLDTTKRGVFKHLSKYFFVENFQYKDSLDIKELKKFAIKQLDSRFKSCNQGYLEFYMRTGTINENFIDSENDELAWHQDEHLATFMWLNEKVSLMLYKNGECIGSFGVDVR